MSKYGVFSGPFFPVFNPNTGIYRPEETSYFCTFHTVTGIQRKKKYINYHISNHRIIKQLKQGRLTDLHVTYISWI